MKTLNVLFCFMATLANALPTSQVGDINLIVRDSSDFEAQGLITRTDLEDGDSSKCPKAILIYARGTTEPGNIGTTAGPVLVQSMQVAISGIWIQGVGGPYKADLLSNFLPQGTNSASINEAKRLFQLAHTKCPNTPVVTAGYSQGAVVVAYALSELSSDVQGQVVGAALFGYTKNKQLNGRIPNYPTDRSKVYCLPTDAVCEGTLCILPAHFLYGVDAALPAPAFLAGKIKAQAAV